ncbi:hypothetical protein BGZ80_009572 [Entomortierella chlamydospora]|uniref:FAD-binding domain-containing protein n=1 Tax=Entomortierella chlamydospora TaxID=101097 RepID=A0A9P6MWB1_9FUNG|nr:hypothetical protein BGZ80_009572 [Entomortierella chlamydospora]
MPGPVDTPIPTVLIVGAGLGGLMLGAILESTDISYHILERATELRPLGSAIALSGNILPAFEQLGIYEELRNASLPHISTDMVPAHKISMGKKVLRTKENDNKVAVYCSDNTIYEYSVLVGADGVYSAVRQNMYKQLEEDGNLPSRDKDAFSIGFITMVGISHPPDPAKYPELNDDNRTHFRLVIGENNDSVKSVDSMLKQFQDFPCGFGGTMKDIFDVTPRELICKVFLEEKLLPGAGQGAVMAMKDAVVLANCIYNMRDESDKSINAAFNSYHRQRHREADEIIKGSNIMTKIMFGHASIEQTPNQLAPLVENRGLGYIIPQDGRKDAEKKSHSV